MLIRDFIPSDADLIDVQEKQLDLTLAIDSWYNYGVRLKELSYKPITVVSNGKVVLIGGLIPILPHMAEGYFLLSKEFKNEFKKEAKTYIKEIGKYINESPFTRIQTSCRCDYPEAKRFLEFLGFESEGLMRQGNPDKTDAIRMVIIR